MHPRNGSVLVVVLFVMALLSLVATSFAYRAGLLIREETSQEIETHLRAQAISAVFIAIGRLQENQNDFDHWAEPWHSHPPLASEGWLSEWSGGDEEPIYVADYQVIDEEGKLNLQVASSEALEILGLSEVQIASLLDWMDGDDVTRSEGAESDYYLSLFRPYRCKNASLELLSEMSLIRGFLESDYWGEDANRNRILDTSENDGDLTYPPDNADGLLQLGCVDIFTCHGDGRINLNTAPEKVLRTLPISEEAVDQILAFRFFDESSSGNLEEHAFRSETDIDQLQGLSETDRDVLKAIGRYTSDHFRIIAQALHRPTGVRYVLEVVIRINENQPEIMEWRIWR